MQRFLGPVLLVAFLLTSTRVSADLILGLESTAVARWGSTTDISITVTNDGAEDAYVSYLQLALQILPSGAAGGSAEITAFALPSTDSAWDNPTTSTTGPDAATLSAATFINGSNDYWSATVSSGVDPQSSTPLYGWIPQGATRTLGVVTVSWTGNASDPTEYTWRLYAVNESPGVLPITSMYNDNYDTIQFVNLQVLPESSETASATVATVMVVPEPANVTLVTTLSVGAFALARRRFQRTR